MIRIDCVEPVDAAWQRWRTDAVAAKNRAIATVAAGRQARIDEALYKRQKHRIVGLFHGKCAYCESPIRIDQTGDLDHFRPKAGVTDADDRPVEIINADGSVRLHPGYYWLAYEWRNLLPTCIACNRPSGRGGVRHGKRNRFPVKGFRARDENEEAREQALLLNPYFDEPANHLQFDRTGVVVGVTDEGRVCEQVLWLNREGLPEERRSVYVAVQLKFFRVITAGDLTTAEMVGIMDELRGYIDGRRPYSAIGRAAISDARAQVTTVSGLL